MMTEPLDIEVGEPIGRLETDTFCPHCNYNLVSQAVLRDGRLQILVVRCPECGRFSAAADRATASRAWLNRAATFFSGMWVMFLALLLMLVTFFLGLMAMGMVMAYVQFQMDPQPQRPLARPAMRYTYHYVPRTANDYLDAARDLRNEYLIMISITFALAILAGAMVTVLLWHLRGWRRWLALAMPLVGCGCSFLIFSLDPTYDSIRAWGQPRIVATLGLELIGVIVGLRLGRPIARFALRMLAPPKLRQHFAFLWIVDGKRLSIERIA
jgi:hypothetical protein